MSNPSAEYELEKLTEDIENGLHVDRNVLIQLCALIDNVHETSISPYIINQDTWRIVDVPIIQHSKYQDNILDIGSYQDYVDTAIGLLQITISYKELEEYIKVMSL